MGCGKSNSMAIQNIASKITYSQAYEMVSKGQLIVIYEDNVLDLTKFAESHPGGKDVIAHLIGKEVSRYIYGGFIIPTKDKPIYHSQDALMKMLKYRVNQLQPDIPNIFSLPNNTTLDTTVWQLVKRVPITPVHSRYHFVSPNAKTLNILPGVEYAGKYFTLTHFSSGAKRNYGLFFTATEVLLPKYLELIEAVTKENQWNPPFNDINCLYRDGIELFIKKKDGFSKLIAELPLNGEDNYKESDCQFKLSGPYGTGLRLHPCPNGLVVAAICGTSIAMWLEIVAYMIRKAVYEVGLKSGKDYRMFKNEKFDYLNAKGFKLILFSSFNKEENAIGKDVFEVMDKISKAYKLDNFEYYLRTTDKKEPHYTEEYFKERIHGIPERLYFWGPLGFSESAQKIFLNLGYKKEIFYNV